MSSTLYARAQALAKQAVEADDSGNYQVAYNKYLEAASILIDMTKFTNNIRLKKTYENRAQAYIDRVKIIKPMIMAPKKENTPTGKSGKPEEEIQDDELDEAIIGSIVSERPDIKLEDVAGLVNVKSALRESIVLPLMRPDLFTGSRRPWKGILLFGPPGCGKTMIAKATAGDVEATFFNISAANLVSKWLGESEKLVKKLYDIAKTKQPSIIFIDEVDSLTQSRGGSENDAMRRVKTQLLTSMEGLSSNPKDRVVTIGATNIPWEIDSAFRRRFERRIFVPIPDLEARAKVFEINSKGIELAPDVNFMDLAEKTDGYSGSDIANICREAIFAPVRELDSSGALSDPNVGARAVNQEDYLIALKNVRSSIGRNELEKFDEWEKEYGAG
jgi:vacuolar protein-sorting-associated protein 4